MQEANTNFVFIGLAIIVLIIIFAVIASSAYGSRYEKPVTKDTSVPVPETREVQVLTEEQKEEAEFKRVLSTVTVRKAEAMYKEIKAWLDDPNGVPHKSVSLYNCSEPIRKMRHDGQVCDISDVFRYFVVGQIHANHGLVVTEYRLAGELETLLQEDRAAAQNRSKASGTPPGFLDRLFVKYKEPSATHADNEFTVSLPLGLKNETVVPRVRKHPGYYMGGAMLPRLSSTEYVIMNLFAWPEYHRLEFFLGHARLSKLYVEDEVKSLSVPWLHEFSRKEFPTGRVVHRYSASPFVQMEALTVSCLDAIRHMASDDLEHRKLYRSAGFLNIELRKGDDIILISDRPAYFTHNSNFDDVKPNTLVSGLVAGIRLEDDEIGMKEFRLGDQNVKWFYNTKRIEA